MNIANDAWSARIGPRSDAALGRCSGDRLWWAGLRQRVPAWRPRHATLWRDPAVFFHHRATLDRVYTASAKNPDTGWVRAELAKEEYATTWQEEEQGQPQEERVSRAEIHRRAKRQALDTLACRRVAQDQRAKRCGPQERGSEGIGQTQHQEKRDQP
jgi:hypothetical protein